LVYVFMPLAGVLLHWQVDERKYNHVVFLRVKTLDCTMNTDTRLKIHATYTCPEAFPVCKGTVQSFILEE